MIDRFLHWQRALQRHPRRVMAALGAVLLGTGVTAFGTGAVDDALAELPQRQVTEAVAAAYTAPVDSAPAPFILYRTDVTRRDDTLVTLLQRLGVDDRAAADFLRRSPQASELWRGRPGKLVSAEVDDDGRLLRLRARWLTRDDSASFQRLTVQRDGERLHAHLESAPLSATVRMASGTIRTSLFAATDAARLPDSIASQLADLFSGDIDFRRDLRAGDSFGVVYEALEADGEVLRYGRLLGAEFRNAGRRHQLVWFQPPQGRGAYYNLQGESLQRAFLASPLAFSRVSSGYGMRFHPVHGDRRAHMGVDYAAPTGTPVRSVADAVVEFAGWQRGYGNVVILQHKQNRKTLYAHLSRIDVRKGQRIEQGQTLGAVGATGTATGPHLHFEYIVGGAHRDPLTLARDNAAGEPIEARWRADFERVASAMREQLAAATTLVQASAE
ncbi:Murein DD-endopeptidase MepM [Tepidimonas thermarum]|uniref:Murein DD-endopeptidase MepM n=1 Tax=Tepidimonas thermarum TaxID=335431 RepID=A0A554X827_9BURK|nr:M23 family metallopeptidase [Tepidimonas thermarum]TSE31985.1 Murein DD-endopeptidase MepM [Tepidimonas thermarum]